MALHRHPPSERMKILRERKRSRTKRKNKGSGHESSHNDEPSNRILALKIELSKKRRKK